MSNPETSYELDSSLWLKTLEGLEDLVGIIGEGYMYLITVQCVVY